MDFNAVIVNLGLLDGEFAAQCIANINNSIHHTKMQIAEQLLTHTDIPLFGRTILEQQFMLLETLEQWENNFERQLLEDGKQFVSVLSDAADFSGFVYNK